MEFVIEIVAWWESYWITEYYTGYGGCFAIPITKLDNGIYEAKIADSKHLNPEMFKFKNDIPFKGQKELADNIIKQLQCHLDLWKNNYPDDTNHAEKHIEALEEFKNKVLKKERNMQNVSNFKPILIKLIDRQYKLEDIPFELKNYISLQEKVLWEVQFNEGDCRDYETPYLAVRAMKKELQIIRERLKYEKEKKERELEETFGYNKDRDSDAHHYIAERLGIDSEEFEI